MELFSLEGLLHRDAELHPIYSCYARYLSIEQGANHIGLPLTLHDI